MAPTTGRALIELEPLRDSPVRARYLTKHADVVAALRDPRLSSQRPGGPPAEGASSALPIAVFSRTMLSTDPPDHTRLRTHVARHFTPRTIAHLRGVAEAFVDDALVHEELDVVDALASPLPVAIVCEILGVAEEHRPAVAEWSADLAGLAELGLDRTIVDAGNHATRAFVELLDATTPLPGSLLASLRASRDLSRDELLGTAIHLLFAGHETTTSLIATGLLVLAHHPDQWSRVCDDAAMVPSVVEELARYITPAQVVVRWDEEGAVIVGCLGAANRDPDVFRDPDALDVGRDPNPHVTFGHGAHFCLGAALARLEATVVFERLAARRAELDVVGAPEWRPHTILRGVSALRMRLG